MLTDRANITTAIRYEVAFGLSMAYLVLTLAYLNRQIRIWNGVLPDILAVLVKHCHQFLKQLFTN